MTSSKTIFLKNQDLLKWWIGVCHDDRFEQVLTFCRGEIMELRPTGDQMIGCELAFATMQTLPDSDAPRFDINDAGVGLDHNLTHERKVDESVTTKED